MSRSIRVIPIESIALFTPLACPLYHDGGPVLHGAGETLTVRNRGALRAAGITHVTEAENAEVGRLFAHSVSVKQILVTSQHAGEQLRSALYDDRGRLLLAAGAVITDSFLRLLEDRGVRHVYIERSDAERQLDQVRRYRDLLSAETPAKPVTDEELALPPEAFVKDAAKTLTEEAINRRVETGNVVVVPTGDALRERIASTDPSVVTSPDVKQVFVEMRSFCMESARHLFSHSDNGGADGGMIRNTSTRVINALITHKELLLSMLHLADDREYLPYQAVNTTIIAINLATALGFSARQVHEVAYGAFLHDIGMLRVPAHLIFSADRLREEARRVVERHAEHGVEILQRVSGIPVTCPIVAYQHHERLDGSGYPRRRRENLIHTFSRIVMISDIFSAMTGPRPFRSALLPYTAMNTVLRLANERRLDLKATHAFLQWIGLFPIGSWVVLQDGRIAKVVGVPPQHPDRPVLRVLYDDNFRPLPAAETLDTTGSSQSPILSACDPPVGGTPEELALAGM